MDELKQIPGFPDYYINRRGDVYSNRCKTMRKLKPQLNGPSKLKYLTVSLSTGVKDDMTWGEGGTEIKILRVHRLVWMTFNGEIPDHLEIDHINSNKLDNRLENLQLLTPSDNMEKYLMERYGTILTHHRDRIMEDLKTLGSIGKVAEKWNCSYQSIFYIKHNKKLKKTNGKYYWVSRNN